MYILLMKHIRIIIDTLILYDETKVKNNIQGKYWLHAYPQKILLTHYAGAGAKSKGGVPPTN